MGISAIGWHFDRMTIDGPLPEYDINPDGIMVLCKASERYLRLMDADGQDKNENVIEISKKKIAELLPDYSKKKVEKAIEIVKMISENPNVSIDEMRISLDVTDRTIARYISELKEANVIERNGPDNGGSWEALKIGASLV